MVSNKFRLESLFEIDEKTTTFRLIENLIIPVNNNTITLGLPAGDINI